MMYNMLDEYGKRLRDRRKARKETQKGLAAKMGMSHRTIMDTELCRSSPKFETVALLSREMDISLDAIVFPETASPKALPKCVCDFYEGMSESEAQDYIDICRAARKLKNRE